MAPSGPLKRAVSGARSAKPGPFGRGGLHGTAFMKGRHGIRSRVVERGCHATDAEPIIRYCRRDGGYVYRVALVRDHLIFEFIDHMSWWLT